MHTEETIDLLIQESVINDTVGPQPLVIITDPDSGAVRAYDRGDRVFSYDGEVLRDQDGGEWELEETGLRSGAMPDIVLERLPGHDAFWFGWFAANPQTRLYSGAGQ